MNQAVYDDYQFQAKYTKTIIEKSSKIFMQVAPVLEDLKHNTDFMVMKIGDATMACRIRRHNAIKYLDEFTLRESRPTGAATELQKVMDGFGRYLFYGFAAAEPPGILAYTIGDLDVFREYIRKYHQDEMPGYSQKNGDGTTFRVMKWSYFPDNFIVESEGIERKPHVPIVAKKKEVEYAKLLFD